MNREICTRLLFTRKFITTRCRYFSCVSSNVNAHLYSKEKTNKRYPQYRHPCSNQIRFSSTQPYRGFFSPDNPAISFAMDVLQTIHDTTGLPWWGTIILTTVTLRTVVTLPLAVLTHKNMAKLELIIPEKINTKERIKYEIAMAVKLKQLPEKDRARKFYDTLHKKTVEMYERENCHPAKNVILAMVQLPLWASISIAFRCLSNSSCGGQGTSEAYQSLLTEGTLWFTNLTVPDPTFVLPLMLGLLNLAVTEIHLNVNTPVMKRPIVHKVLPVCVRGISIMLVPIACFMPSCMSFYWVISSSFGLMQAVLLKIPTVRQSFGIPKTPSQSDTPFRDIIEHKKKFFRRKNKSKEEISQE